MNDERKSPADLNGAEESNKTEPERGDFEGNASGNDASAKPKGGLAAKLAKNKKALYPIIGAACLVMVAFILFSTHVICFHQTWINATCEEPKHCADCGKTEGEALGHEWIEATCTEPKACMRCGKTEGEALGHTIGKWEDDGIDYVSATHSRIQKCTICGKVVNTDEQDVESFIESGKFSFTPAQFRNRFDDKLQSISGLPSSLSTVKMSDDGLLSYALIGSGTVGMLSFSSSDGESNIQTEQESERCNPTPIVLVDMSSPNAEAYLAGLSVILVESCDPSLSFEEAKATAKNMIGKGTSANGIDYLFASDGSHVLMRAVVS